MYFLNGDRIYIAPVNRYASPEEQLYDCMERVTQIDEGKKIFKLNFFADTPSDEAYDELISKIDSIVKFKFITPVVYSVISQPPVNCSILVEAFYYDPSLWKAFFIDEDCGQAILFKKDKAEVLIGNLQAGSHKHCRENAMKR